MVELVLVPVRFHCVGTCAGTTCTTTRTDAKNSAPQAAKEEEDHYDYEQPALLLGFTTRQVRRVRFRIDGGARTDLETWKMHVAYRPGRWVERRRHDRVKVVARRKRVRATTAISKWL